MAVRWTHPWFDGWWMPVSLVDLVESWILRRRLRDRGQEHHLSDAGLAIVIPDPWTLRPTSIGRVTVLWRVHAKDRPWDQELAPGDILTEVSKGLKARSWRWRAASGTRRDVHVARATAWARAWRLGLPVPPLLLDKQGTLLDGYHRLVAARALGRETIACVGVRRVDRGDGSK